LGRGQFSREQADQEQQCGETGLPDRRIAEASAQCNPPFTRQAVIRWCLHRDLALRYPACSVPHRMAGLSGRGVTAAPYGTYRCPFPVASCPANEKTAPKGG
jgi:hypothetical protein